MSSVGRLILVLLLGCTQVFAFRVLVGTKRNGSYPRPYESGFVGIYGDPTNFQRERINEGALETPDKELLYEDTSPRQSCPGMVGPFSDGAYYCGAREFGYCDRRSGTCFCNTGYQGIDCSSCQDSHYREGAHCFPKKLCPADCSRAGTCNFNNGTCTCLPHRRGTMCETLLCSIHSPLCVSCTATGCLQCQGGYYLTGDSRTCGSCYDFDPRCAGCIKEEGCTVCADSTLTSVRRSGYRKSDPELPAEEFNREFSITLPFGTKSAESFAEAESYFVASTPDYPLKNISVTCSQGLQNDSSWTCSPYQQSHIVCGHYGVFKFAYPNYEVLENANYIRMYVQRSGGGYGNVTINYYIKHYTTSDSDVVATAPYTTVQQLSFEHGVVEKSFLITILDDNVVEENEVFQVVLETPEGGGAVGAQFRANVTIIDDDLEKISPKLSYFTTDTTSARAGSPFSVLIQARLPTGGSPAIGGDRFVALLENTQAAVSPDSKRQTSRHQLEITDLGTGQYLASLPAGVQEQGVYQVRAYHALPRGILGEYFYDAFFENLAVRRIDHNVNFTWGTGRLIPRGSDSISIRWTGGLRVDATGRYRFAVNADDLARLWVDGILLMDHMHERSVFEEAPRWISLTAGKICEVVLEYVELNSEAFASLLWAFENAPLAVIPQDHFYTLFEIDRSPTSVMVLSSYTSAHTTECSGNGLYTATTLTPASFTVCPRDMYGNLRDDDDLYYLRTEFVYAVMTLSSRWPYEGQGSSDLHPTLTYNPSTHCFDAFYVPDLAGMYQLNITYSDGVTFVGNGTLGEHVRGSPFVVQVSPSKASGPRSEILDLPPLPLQLEAGTCVDFIVRMRDEAGNLLLRGGDRLLAYIYRVDYHNRTAGIPPPVTFTPSQRPSMAPTTAAVGYSAASADPPRRSDSGLDVLRYGVVSDKGNGNYSVRVCPVIAGRYELHVLLNGRGTSHQPERVMDRYFSTSLPSGRGSYLGQYVGRSPLDVHVAHSSASVITSTVQGDGLQHATTDVVSSFLLTVRDAYDNVLRTPSPAVHVAVRLDKSPNATVSVWNYQNGSYLLQYTPQLSGLNYLSVYVDHFQILGSPFNVTVASGATAADTSFAMGAGLHTGSTGKTSYLAVLAFDSQGNRKADYGDNFTFSTTGANVLAGELRPCPSPPELHHPVCDPLDVQAGYYFGSFTPVYAGDMTVHVFLTRNGVHSLVSNAPFPVTIFPSEPQAEASDISGTLYETIAGYDTRVDVHLRDYFGNLVQTGGADLEIALLGVATDWGTVQPFHAEQGRANQYTYRGFYAGCPNFYGRVVDLQDGSYVLTYRLPQTGQYVLRLALAEAGLNATFFNDTHWGHLTDGDFASRDFVLSLEGRPDSYGSSWAWTGDIGGPAGPNGSRGHSTYYHRYFTTAVAYPELSLSTSFPRTYLPPQAPPAHHFREHYWSVRWTGRLTAPTAEVYKLSIDLDEQSEVAVYLGGLGVETNASHLGSLVVHSTRTTPQPIGWYNFTDTKPRELRIDLAHYTGDAVFGLYWESVSTPRQRIPASAFSHWRNISHYNTTVHPAALCPHCSTSFGAARYTARVGHEASFLVYARDVFGNLRQRGGEGPAMLAVGVDGVLLRGKVTDYGNSTYLVRYYPTQAGVFQMYVSVGCCPPSSAVGLPRELQEMHPLLIAEAPFTLTVQSDDIAVERCAAGGTGVVGGIAGERLSFTVWHKDRFYNPTTIAPEDLRVRLVFLDAVRGDEIQPARLQLDKTAEHTVVHYQLLRAGVYTLHVLLSSTGEAGYKHVVASPFSLRITAAVADAHHVVVRGVGTREAVVNTTVSFEIAPRDAFENYLAVGGNKFYTRLEGDADFSSRNWAVVPSCLDTQQGRYVCQYTPRYASARHWLVVRLLRETGQQPGGAGLRARYFDSREGAWLKGEDVLPRWEGVDRMVSFSWPRGEVVSTARPAVGRSNATAWVGQAQAERVTGQSVRWDGYLVAPRTDSFSLRVATERCQATVFVDSVLVFDSAQGSVRPVYMILAAAYRIEVVVIVDGEGGEERDGDEDEDEDEEEVVSVDLRWKSAVFREQSIASFFLYDQAEEVGHSPFPVHVHAS